MKKRVFYSEMSYIIGLLLLACGTALMEKADFGVSMVVAPAYLLHLKVSEFLPFFSFGMAEYTFQAVLLIITMLIVRKVKFAYLFSLITAVIYGFLLDGALLLTALIPSTDVGSSMVFYTVGILLCTAAISLLFHSYISPEAYEMFVKEISQKFGFDLHKCKTIYDCSSCVLSILLSFAFFGFGNFEGIKWGTAVSAVFNGLLIAMFTKIFERFFVFKDRFPLKKYF